MKITLDVIQIIDLIVKTGSFDGAAHELGRVRSALTYKVKQLEENLGVSIFDRSGHRAVLTPSGKLVLSEGRAILIAARRLEKRIELKKGGWETSFSLLYNDLIPLDLMLGLVQNFQNIFPEINISLRCASTKKCWQALRGNEVTLVVGVTNTPPMGFKCGYQLLGNIEFVLVASPDHQINRENEISLEEIESEYCFVTFGEGMGPDNRPIPRERFIEVNSLHAMEAVITKGIGLGYMPTSHIRRLVADNRLVLVQEGAHRCTSSLSLAWSFESSGKVFDWWQQNLMSSIAKWIT